jgi:peptidoglycan-associated lipoprotein
MKTTQLLFIAAFALAACTTPRSGSKSSLAKGKGKDGKGGAAEAAPLPPLTEVTEASLRGSGFDMDPKIQPVTFEYDSAQLSDETLAVLKANAEIMKDKKDQEFLVAGHCDERGTVAYNLALGQKRAKEVREYYIRLGVDGRRVATISYGKEQPECLESTEECWARNRRAVTGARARAKGKGAAPAAGR